MANREACEVYIEQEIKEALAQGKKPYSIGKELSAWVEKLFETSIPADTLRKRAERLGTNVHTDTITIENNSETPKNPGGRPLKYEKVPEPKHGGKREGAGEPRNYQTPPALGAGPGPGDTSGRGNTTSRNAPRGEREVQPPLPAGPKF